MHSEEAGVRNAFYWVATGVVLVNLPVAVLDVLAHPGAYVPGFAPVVLALIGALCVAALWRASAGYGAATPLKAIVVVSCIALAAHPWAMDEPVTYPPLLHVLGAGMVISAILSVRGSLLIIPVFATAVAMLRAPEIGPWQAGEEAALQALAGLVGTACVDVFARAGRSVDEAVGRSWQLAEEKVRLVERDRAREHWDGLIHDTVLGALSLAARSRDGRVPAAARDLANEARAAFRGEGASSPAIDRWQDHARRLGLQARFRVQGRIADPKVREAFVGAVNEALTNVYRHSGQLAVTVSGTLSSGQALIAVTDRGQGFEPQGLTRGLGLPTSVVARMRAIGGEAEVRSSPGAGTRVVLAWQPTVERPDRVGMQWQLRRFIPMSALAWAVLVATLLVSHRQWTAAVHPWVTAGTIIAIVLLTAATTIAPPTGRNAIVIVVAMTATTLACVLNTPLDAVPDWRYWYLSALMPAIVAMSYRFSGWSSGWVVLALVATVMAVDAWVGRPFWACLTGPVPVLLATVLAAQLIRRTLAEAWEAVEEATRRGAELRLAVAAEAEREREAGERIDALEESVGSVLAQLGAGRDLPAGGAAELEQLGAAVRDHLAAPELLDARLVGELRSARLRGVDVDVVAAPRASASGPRQDCAVCRCALASILAHAGPGVRVRVVWSPGDALRSTFAVVGPDLDGLAARISRDAAPQGRVAVAVTDDTDALLVEFTTS
jgi:signal transduction histidine kinase